MTSAANKYESSYGYTSEILRQIERLSYEGESGKLTHAKSTGGYMRELFGNDYNNEREGDNHRPGLRIDSPDPGEGCIFVERQFNADRVPSIEEVHAFMGLMEHGSYWWCAFGVMFYGGLRPCEVARLSTDCIIRCPNTGAWDGFNYKVGKAKPPGRPKKGEKPKKGIHKYNKVSVRRNDLPKFIMDALMYYWATHNQKHGKLFPNFYGLYHKRFSALRKKMIQLGFKNWGRPANPTKPLKKGFVSNRKVSEYAISPYSGRRFFLTFYYWCVTPHLSSTMTPDRTIAQRRICHSTGGMTDAYIYPFPDLGIRREDAKLGWEVLVGSDTEQSRLTTYF